MNSASASCIVIDVNIPIWRCAARRFRSALRAPRLAEADVRIGRFREGAEIENAWRRRQPLQRGHRTRLIVKFAVIVVFDDAGAGGIGIAKQFEVWLIGMELPRRLLVRRGDEDDPRRILSGSRSPMPCSSSGMAETMAPAALTAPRRRGGRLWRSPEGPDGRRPQPAPGEAADAVEREGSGSGEHAEDTRKITPTRGAQIANSLTPSRGEFVTPAP